jgi:biotin transport system ATP-binding protein
MIEVEDLVSGYGDETVLSDITMTVRPHEWIVIAGPNGSGKTTLVRHFNGLEDPDSGTVRVDGTLVQEDLVAARTSVGMVFQNPRDTFVTATVGADVSFGPENLGLDRAEIDRRVEAALEAVNMAGRENDRIDELSGGEAARVAIAGALAMEPTYLVLDEPFAGLDWPARRSVLEHLDGLRATGTGIVVVSHDLRDLLDRTDRIVGLDDGKIAVNASPDDALEDLTDIDVRIP